MTQLDHNGKRLLAYLVTKLNDAMPNHPETYVTYKQVHDDLKLPYEGPTYGESLKRQGLNNLAGWTKAENKPGITGIIVSEERRVPGKGYFHLFGRDPDSDFRWWAEQVSASKATDWTPYITGIVKTPDTPVAIDKEPIPPERAETTVYRILRDTKLAKYIKALHNHECQICGHFIELNDGTRYAEAHHIKPLGQPHNGPDEIGNILCLCPNHHAELDYGASELITSNLVHRENHILKEEYISYHNSVIYNNTLG